MKRFLAVLLSLGLIIGFSVSAFAVTPDFAGQYFARGWYFSNPSLLEDTPTKQQKSFSYADQRLRLFWRLKIVDGVTFTTRLDAMETIWGLDQAIRPTAAAGASKTSFTKGNEPNLSFEQSYVTFASPIGQFKVGYMSATPYSSWGTIFMDSTGTAPGVAWQKTFGNATVLADWFVQGRKDFNTNGSGPLLTATDVSDDLYDLGLKYKLQSGDAGILWSFFRYATTKNALLTVHNFQPYIRTKVGPINLEAEGYWALGKNTADDNPATPEQDVNTKGLWLDARYNMGPAYIGGRFIYASGDDPTTNDKVEGSGNSTFGYAKDKSLWGDISALMWNLYATTYVPLKGDASVTAITSTLDNAWVYQLYGGYSPTKKIDLSFRYHYMKADQDPVATGWQSKNYGSELDLKATYKIYDVLTYNVGAAYLWTGDYFKGTNAAAQVKNLYLLMHWIDLNF